MLHNQRIIGTSRKSALKHGFKGCIALILMLERKIINKYNEFKRKSGNLVNKKRKVNEPVLRHFNNAESVLAELVCNCLDC